MRYLSIRRSPLPAPGPFVLGSLSTPTSSSPAVLPNGEENVGPFANWVNVKTAYGAVGNGITDDTTAIQNALTDLVGGTFPILYFPTGTYLITSEVKLIGSSGVGVMGDGASLTTWLWGGSANSTMFLVDGCGYAQYRGITFDGGHDYTYNLILVDVSQQTSMIGTFNTGSKFEECTFQHARNGLTLGVANIGTSEMTVLRCNWHDFNYGESLYNANCLDIWNWYCTFDATIGLSQWNCIALTNKDFALNSGAGAYSAYGCVFYNQYASLASANTDVFNYRGNYSISCNWHIFENFAADNASATRSQNEFVNGSSQSWTSGAANWGQSIYQGNMGPLNMTDITLQSQQTLSSPPPGNSNTPVEIGGSTAGDILSVGNTFSVTGAEVFDPSGGRLETVDDTVQSWASFNIVPPTITPLPNYGRAIIEVTAGSSEATIQAAINTAAAANNGTIVHLQFGNYTISSGLSCPANSYFQISGDGWFTGIGSQLNYSGSGVCLTLNGPSKVTLRDFYINMSGSGTGITIAGADQSGGRVWGHQVSCTLASGTGFKVDSLNNALVQFLDFQMSQMSTGTGLQVIGGSSPQAACQTNILSGASAANLTTLVVSGPANVVLRDTFFDNGGSPSGAQFATLTGACKVTIEGCQTYTPNGNPWVACTGFTGIFTALSNLMQSNVTLDATSTGDAWVIGNNFDTATTWSTSNSGSGTANFNNNRRYNGTASIVITDVGSPSSTFIRTMLAQSRACQPAVIASTGAGVTDVRMYRIWVNAGATGYHVTT